MMIDVRPITPCDLSKTLCTGTAVVVLNNTLFKASVKTIKFIQEYSNEKICITDETPVKSRPGNERLNQKLERQGYPVTA